MPESNDFTLGRVEGKLDTLIALQAADRQRFEKLEATATSAAADRAALGNRLTNLEARAGSGKTWLSYLFTAGAVLISLLGYLKELHP